ncbi:MULTISPECIES: helix-turn-helix domain-containing protein [Bacillus cereus group]|uniref:XRE family transcriptional regulator n=3 Tax=Bacillaceae TaxID=186817 RepID=A0ABD6SJN2_BACTU|nr:MULTISPECIES: helix-turn-helix transcriptional regulator [Bacillus cereus group]AYY25394.1 XRE family transcriptional regulator [Bacillus sp. FDAARGOS_527]PER52606.1 XRE family transcriptional regulator [Bacillus thuringiensis]PEU81831.1 XRE family transcriptional regulator [Bacillus thuringiensis]PFH96566.1 XRE family transcriptional regulator [Bacillus thuringiensis]PFW29025.1 XRE family transcriptional regulator [Bacillus thuringiensis]
MENIDIKERFGMSIKYYRNKKEISQEKLAEITGLHRTYISEVERGNRNVSLINISKIAAALDINVSDLFTYINL